MMSNSLVTYPALTGMFGSTRYFVVTMRVSDLIGMIQFPADLPGWEERSLEDRFQRKLDIGRIRRHMAPYFANDNRRFSGSLVVAAQNKSGMDFESIDDVAKERLPLAYSSNADDFGFLTLTNQKLIPLDGQHRAKAFQMAMEDKNSKLGNDKISVIVIKFDESISRYIFNKINKYARPTSKAGKLITDDDDAMAIMTRGLIADGIIPKRLVNIESASLNKNAHEFTLLSTFYDANRALLSTLPVPTVGDPRYMKEAERIKTQKDISVEWKRLTSGITEWKKALADPNESGDKGRIELREKSILGRPIGQLALVKGYSYAYSKGIDKDTIVKNLNKIDWSLNGTAWQGILVKPNGRMMYGVRVANTASKMIAHLVGVKLSRSVANNLLDYVHGTKRSSKKKLPKPVDTGK